jgi:hypothetical protein
MKKRVSGGIAIAAVAIAGMVLARVSAKQTGDDLVSISPRRRALQSHTTVKS